MSLLLHLDDLEAYLQEHVDMRRGRRSHRRRRGRRGRFGRRY